VNYADCTACIAGKFEISPAPGSYKYCVDVCPTAYTAGAAPSCTIPGTLLVLSYSFNVPAKTITNDGSAGATFNILPTRDAPGGNPAKDRGIYFVPGKTAYLDIPIILPHTFAVHSWILMKVATTKKVILAKDRNVFTGKSVLNLYINATDKLEVELTKDSDGAVTSTKNGGALVINTWYYTVFSFEMTGGDTTNVEIFIASASVGTDTFTGKFVIDATAYKTYLGAERTAAAVWVNNFNGYIYDLHVYYKKHVNTDVVHSGAGCTSGCITFDFNKYDDGGEQTCDPTTCADISCVKSGVCNAPACHADYPFCHLCVDRECTGCDTYVLCKSDKCLGTANSVF
jgi:hypothetical protein